MSPSSIGSASPLRGHVPGFRVKASSLPDQTLPVDGSSGLNQRRQAWCEAMTAPAGRVAFVAMEIDALDSTAPVEQLRAAAGAYTRLDLHPRTVISHLRGLFEHSPALIDGRCFYAVFDRGTATLTYANAGLAPPILKAADGSIRRLAGGRGASLGTAADVGAEEETAFPEGAELVIAAGEKLLLATRTDSEVIQEAAVTIRATRSAPRLSREFTRHCLDEWCAGRFEERVVAVVCELVTNAVTHARSDVELLLRREDRSVVVEVSDLDHRLPRVRRAGGGCESFRGLMIVESESSRWGARSTPSGKTVWAEIDEAVGVRWEPSTRLRLGVPPLG